MHYSVRTYLGGSICTALASRSVCTVLYREETLFMNPLFWSLLESNRHSLYKTNLINNSVPESAVAASHPHSTPPDSNIKNMNAALSRRRLENWLHRTR